MHLVPTVSVQPSSALLGTRSRFWLLTSYSNFSRHRRPSFRILTVPFPRPLQPMATLTSLESLQVLLANNLSTLHRPRVVNIACAIGALYAIIKVVQATRKRMKTTALRGPPSSSFLWGVGRMLLTSPDSGLVFEKWAEEYGSAFEVASPLGGKKIVLCDPKAVAHMFGLEPWTYVLTPFGHIGTERFVGKGILTSRGESHRRQRKTLTPAFSNAAIRSLTSVFYDSAYKIKGIWDSLIESNGGDNAIIEVQNWMNHISLDTIGIAGFSHEFGALDGKRASVTEVFDMFSGGGGSTVNLLLILLANALPWLVKIPTSHSKLVQRLNDTMGEISDELLSKSRKEKEAGTLGEREEKSILGLLIKAETQEGQLHLTREEVTGQAKVLLLAGYETTSISLTWALIELCKNPDIQTKLRMELLEFGADPTYDQLPNSLPYLDAVVHETLRMHPPLPDFNRVATADDMIPLSKPIQTRSGKFVDYISVTKGTTVSISVPFMNRSTAFWGPDAKVFRPERWLDEDGIPARAKEIQGHRHLLTFIDGPRTCLGKGFAIAEFKIVLSVLIKNFVFALRDGPEVEIGMERGILPRPKVVGEEGASVPMRVRRFNE
ncbi:cytochrome P450 [Chiua virens]|nr:cytochrome P450 [Chiua virens]